MVAEPVQLHGEGFDLLFSVADRLVGDYARHLEAERAAHWQSRHDNSPWPDDRELYANSRCEDMAEYYAVRDFLAGLSLDDVLRLVRAFPPAVAVHVEYMNTETLSDGLKQLLEWPLTVLLRLNRPPLGREHVKRWLEEACNRPAEGGR